jgi:hypothetical protein
MLYVINKYRPMTSGSQDAAALFREIEAASRLKATESLTTLILCNLQRLKR